MASESTKTISPIAAASLADWTTSILVNVPGLNWYQINSEPESGSDWTLSGPADLAFLDSLKAGESAAFVLQGAFESGTGESWTFDFINDLDKTTWSRYGNDFRLVVFASPGLQLKAAKAVGGDFAINSNLTSAVLSPTDPYAASCRSVARHRWIHFAAPGLDASLHIANVHEGMLLHEPAAEVPAAHPRMADHGHGPVPIQQAIQAIHPFA